MILVNPAEAYLPSYVAALERGWSPDNLRPEATHEHLARIAANAAAFLEAQVDLEAAGDPIALPDGTTVPRLPGMVRWMWDGEFCGTVGFRWQPGTEALPPMCLGHIGYCVVPWKRRRGYATRAVQETLPFARQQGLRYVEITTTRDNRPSQGVVEKCGGTFVEEFVAPAALGGRTHRRYRIALSATAAAEAGSDDSVAGKPSRASICVFCGSSPGARPEYRHAAEALGRAIATQGRTLVYGGGNVGLMCAVADAVLHGGGRVTGVIPQHLVAREVAHGSLTELKIVESMHERKQLMATLADAFVLLPGGLGSLEEFFEVWTWGQLGLHAKPYGLLNVSGYFDPLLAFVDHAVQERFVRSEHRGLLLVDENPERLLSRLDAHAPPTHPKWIDRERR